MSFFRGLRRTNKVYNEPSSFINDHTLLIRNQTPSGFNLNNPTSIRLPDGTYAPGYNINGQFISNSNVNTTLRNNDVISMRNLFPDASNNQMNGLTNLRRADNIPDATLHSLNTRKTSIKDSHPETRVKNREGVENALSQNPRLADYLRGAGYTTLFGVSVYLVINVADLVGSIVEALNRTGGSWYYRGNNGGDNLNNIQACILRYRSCGMSFADISNFVCELDPHDPNNVDPLMNFNQARDFCNGYNFENEGSVCRGSDTNADPLSLQYLDISELEPNQTIQCVEPYDFGDLIGDLGLEWLLGDNGLITTSSNSLTSISDNFLTIVLVIGAVIFLIFIGYIIFKLVNKKNDTI
ncbi:odv-e56 [Cryptophlebia leucotreta granulovirus]|uniref:Odv-e56 n=1 Tax=Cryptophlebia leucotreta granulosis virus TaxID=35254 RepID=Q7T5S0_GVCL|nr:odv-e56 [Cryptophlebia leucotreta granulovirus]AAQ21614.1 odv-e56 [Cryptophlebia leucotreta granulovirus]